MATTTTMSGAAFDQLPYEEGRQSELLQGEVITEARPTPEHRIVVTILSGSLLDYFLREPGGVDLPDCEFALGEDDRLCPDVAILLRERASVDRKKTQISSGETLSRLGIDKESAGRLERKAAEAEEKIGIHGVSTTAGEPKGPASSAPRADVEPHFPVHDTPTRNDPQHRTVELPKPVTQKVGDLFNKIFGRD